MAYSYVIDKQHGVVRTKVTGQDTVITMKTRIEEITSDPDWKPRYNILVDLRDTYKFDLSVMDIEELASLHESLRSVIGGGKLAVVASSDAVYGVSRMWETVTESHTFKMISVFRELREAEDWLGIPRSEEEMG